MKSDEEKFRKITKKQIGPVEEVNITVGLGLEEENQQDEENSTDVSEGKTEGLLKTDREIDVEQFTMENAFPREATSCDTENDMKMERAQDFFGEDSRESDLNLEGKNHNDEDLISDLTNIEADVEHLIREDLMSSSTNNVKSPKTPEIHNDAITNNVKSPKTPEIH